MVAKNQKPNYKVLALDNGATLYVLHMPWVQTVGLGVHVNVGTRDESWPKQAGLAHAMEHMVFQGTEDFPKSQLLAEEIEVVGGRINAYTGSEMTFFYAYLPSEEKERGFRALSQLLLRPLLPAGKIKIEMKNIIEEIKMYNDNPQSFIDEKAAEFLYGDHPLAKRTLGTEESLSSFKRVNFLRWLKKFYHCSNFTFIATGDIKPAAAKYCFENYFPKRDSSPSNKRKIIPIPALKTPDDLIIKKEIEQAHVILGAISPEGGARDSYILKVFRIMLAGGMSFPLFQEIRDKRGLCYHIGADISSWSDAGIFTIYLGIKPENIQKAEEAIHEVIRQTKSSPVLLEKAKQLMRGNLAFVFESPAQLIGSVGLELTFNKKLRGYDERLEEINSVTIEEIEGVADRYLMPEKIVKVALLPKSSSG